MDKPGNIYRNQIDFIMVNKRFKNSCTSVKTYPGADIGSNHVPLVGVFAVRLKNVNKKRVSLYDLRKLQEQVTKEKATRTINTKIQASEEKDIETEMTNLGQAVESVKKELLKPDGRKKKSWMTEEILNLMEERRINKGNESEYRRIQKIIRGKIREAKDKEMTMKCEEIEFFQSKYDEFNVGT
uniref:Craniofacial development protein 2 n=3 Tax=Cacopsylla melanoneura TaxID=428564 RepID=A0A8D8R7S7_9HEMI